MDDCEACHPLGRSLGHPLDHPLGHPLDDGAGQFYRGYT